ncbi:SdpI family protein [Patiriisocius hiemis]|uniref:SdpI family protein n=1 Tax=Patiriisocius hiemis TaxID=3075604 RepID=A0ABU2YE98_9FLAO|nr:SdpI family protein [Constantimarinum sp. W242]MDT0556503.1 SdpI family protein [Constantimarinum sp. W242]
MSPEIELLVSIGYCIFIIVLALVLKKFPPKKINHFYGYRTTRSMKNQNIWTVANTYASNLMLKVSLYSLIFPLLCYFIIPDYNFLITVIANTLLVCSIIFFTEKHLSKNFDANGKPK